jgi:hypothetical protein
MENYNIIESVDNRIMIGNMSRDNPLKLKIPRYITIHESANKELYNEYKKKFIENAILYEGDPSKHDMKHYTNKMEQLQNSVKQFGLLINYIWYSKTQQGTKIIGKSSDENIMWVVNTCSSWGGNHIYINKHKIKLSEWLKMNDLERKDKFESSMGYNT